MVNDRITAAEARGSADSLGGRPPLLWDNYPVNDAMMADRLFLGPLRGRDPGLAEACSGYLANAMVQPRCSMLPLASVAAYLDGDDPTEHGPRPRRPADVGRGVRRRRCPVALAEHLVDEVDGPGWLDSPPDLSSTG